MARKQRPSAGKSPETPKVIPNPPSRWVSGSLFNRELSWLEFNQRVLDEALDSSVPLLERVKFFGITHSNLDEFFEVRVAGLKQQIESEGGIACPMVLPPASVSGW